MAYTIFLALEGAIYTKIADITSESAEDVDLYDGSLYDLSTSAAFNGGTTYEMGQQLVTQSTLSAIVGQNGALAVGPNTGANMAGYDSTPINMSIPSATKVAPVPQPRKRRRYKWVTATGLYWAWGDQIIAVSPSPFGYNGSPLPA